MQLELLLVGEAFPFLSPPAASVVFLGFCAVVAKLQLPIVFGVSPVSAPLPKKRNISSIETTPYIIIHVKILTTSSQFLLVAEVCITAYYLNIGKFHFFIKNLTKTHQDTRSHQDTRCYKTRISVRLSSQPQGKVLSAFLEMF